MIEDTIYRTSSQFRFWSFTDKALRDIRISTNESASERVRAAISKVRQQSGTPPATGPTSTSTSGAGVDGKETECLNPEEEHILVRYYCEKTLELGDVYNPPLPTTVRVCSYSEMKRRRRDTFLISFLAYYNYSPSTGHSSTIPPSFLSYKFSHDISPQKHHGMRPLPRNKDRKPPHIASQIRQSYSR